MTAQQIFSNDDQIFKNSTVLKLKEINYYLAKVFKILKRDIELIF